LFAKVGREKDAWFLVGDAEQNRGVVG